MLPWPSAQLMTPVLWALHEFPSFPTPPDRP
jgi:hypothetical protein